MWGPHCRCSKFPQIKGTMHSSSFLFVKIWPAFFFALRSVVRRAASLLSKVVDSLAPSITNVLVQGKQVSIRSPHHSHSSFCLGHLVWTPWWHRRLTKRLPVACGFFKSLFSQAEKMHTQSESSRAFSGPSHFSPCTLGLSFSAPMFTWVQCSFQCRKQISVPSGALGQDRDAQSRIMHLVGHSARVMMLRAEARCIAKTRFPSTPPDLSFPLLADPFKFERSQSLHACAAPTPFTLQAISCRLAPFYPPGSALHFRSQAHR